MKTTLTKILRYNPSERLKQHLSFINTKILKYNPSERLKQHLSFINTTNSIDFMIIKKTVGIVDAIWCLRVLDYNDYCLFLADVAESVLPIFEAVYPNDKRPRKAVEGIRAWHNGDIDNEQLYILSNAAYEATYDYDDDYVVHAAYAASAACTATYAINVARAAGSDWEKIEELFIKHFGDR